MDGHNHLFLPYMGVSQAVPSQGKVSTVSTLLMDNQPYSHRTTLFLSPPALLNITEPYWGENRPEMPSQASVVMLGGQWSQFSRATPPQGFLMGLPWNNYTSYTTYRGRGSSCIYWIGTSFPFSHIFNTFLLWFVILSLHCTDTLKHLVQYRAFPKDDKQENGCVCTFLSSGCFPAHRVAPCFSPPSFATSQHITSAVTVMKPQQKRDFVPVLYPYWLW